MVLSAVNVSKNFTREGRGTNILTAVSDVSLELIPGQLICLSGPSGSGKSTLLNMLSGLLPPSDGKILLDDTDIYSLDDAALSLIRNEKLGMIPQGQSALYALNVLENVMVPYTLYHKPSGEEYENMKKKAEELLYCAGIKELASVMPSELSGGELRRMAVCRALLMTPDIVLADEPTGDLDEENTAVVMKMLKAKAEEGGCVFVVTHDSQVYDYADLRLEMKKGLIIK